MHYYNKCSSHIITDSELLNVSSKYIKLRKPLDSPKPLYYHHLFILMTRNIPYIVSTVFLFIMETHELFCLCVCLERKGIEGPNSIKLNSPKADMPLKI